MVLALYRRPLSQSVFYHVIMWPANFDVRVLFRMAREMNRLTLVLIFLIASSTAVAQKPKPIEFNGHTNSVSQVAFAPGGKQLASGSWDETVRLWDPAGGPPRQTLTEHTDWVLAVQFTADGKLLLTASQRSVKAWDPASGQLVESWDGLLGQRISMVTISRDGRQLACGLRDGGVQLHRLDKAKDGKLTSPRQWVGHKSWIDTLVFDHGGTRLATGCRTGEITIWDTGTTKPVSKPAGHGGQHVSALVFSPKGNRLASGGFDTAVRIWSVDDGKPQGVLKGHRGLIQSLCYAPDGLLLASGERHGPIKLWSTVDGSLKTTLPGHSGGQLGFSVHSLDFSSDGKRLASAGRDKKVRVWQVPE